MSEAYAKPLPAPDRDSQPFWDGVRAGELRVQRCDGCGAYRWPARTVCNRCHSFEATWTPLSGRGRIVTWITTHQVFMKAYADTVLNIVDVDDVARGHVLALECGEPGHGYILGGENLHMRQVMQLLSELTGFPCPRLAIPPRLLLAAARRVRLEYSLSCSPRNRHAHHRILS